MPRVNLLDRFSQVSVDGAFTSEFKTPVARFIGHVGSLQSSVALPFRLYVLSIVGSWLVYLSDINTLHILMWEDLCRSNHTDFGAGGLVAGRVFLTTAANNFAKVALATAIRYALQRRQFAQEANSSETLLMVRNTLVALMLTLTASVLFCSR